VLAQRDAAHGRPVVPGEEQRPALGGGVRPGQRRELGLPAGVEVGGELLAVVPLAPLVPGDERAEQPPHLVEVGIGVRVADRDRHGHIMVQTGPLASRTSGPLSSEALNDAWRVTAHAGSS
jgi:hypothetical protein